MSDTSSVNEPPKLSAIEEARRRIREAELADDFGPDDYDDPADYYDPDPDDYHDYLLEMRNDD